MPNLSAYPSVFIYGVPGSGKTTFAQEELNKRLALGHEVIVLDPHAAYGAWPCCSVIGGGMNYQAINDKLDWLFKEVKDRYARIEKEPNPKFRPLTITAEEFTKWSANVKNSGELFRTALTDIRQIKIYIVFVSHTRTLIALRNAKGLAPLRDEGLLEVELKGESSQDNEGTGEATHYTLGDIKGEKVTSYRDTTGVDRPTFERILQQCDRTNLSGKRDYALLRLLWGNALRRNEVSQLNVRDFDPTSKTLRIFGKGRGTQAEVIDLGSATVHAITDWLDARGGNSSQDAPLFTALDFANTGHRLTGDGLRKIIVRHSENAGISKQMSPHRIRHSAITAALDATDGDVRKV